MRPSAVPVQKPMGWNSVAPAPVTSRIRITVAASSPSGDAITATGSRCTWRSREWPMSQPCDCMPARGSLPTGSSTVQSGAKSVSHSSFTLGSSWPASHSSR